MSFTINHVIWLISIVFHYIPFRSLHKILKKIKNFQLFFLIRNHIFFLKRNLSNYYIFGVFHKFPFCSFSKKVFIFIDFDFLNMLINYIFAKLISNSKILEILKCFIKFHFVPFAKFA